MPTSIRALRPSRRALACILLSGLAAILPRPAWSANAVTGPAGSGPERWVSGSQFLVYRVDLENAPGPGAVTAQVARVTVVLDPSLDVATFRIGSAGFGGNNGKNISVPSNVASFDNGGIFYADLGFYVQYTASVDALTRTATFTFRTLDAALQPPADPQIGFLPVNDPSGSGTGFIVFRVKAAADAEQGAVIHTAASIQLDARPPVAAAPAQNTLDTEPPTSQALHPVAPLGGDEYAIPLVSDDGLGSGVSQIALYVSTDGGPYTLATIGPAAELDTLTLASGHLHAIYSQAADLVGQLEPTKSQPDLIVDLTSGTLGVGSGGPAARAALAITALSDARLSFALAMPAAVSATVFDVQGRPVRALITGAPFAAGDHTLGLAWDGVASGLYFVEVRAGDHRARSRLVHLR